MLLCDCVLSSGLLVLMVAHGFAAAAAAVTGFWVPGCGDGPGEPYVETAHLRHI
jgi:hypothetical protein